jgi:hypothetical protein
MRAHSAEILGVLILGLATSCASVRRWPCGRVSFARPWPLYRGEPAYASGSSFNPSMSRSSASGEIRPVLLPIRCSRWAGLAVGRRTPYERGIVRNRPVGCLKNQNPCSNRIEKAGFCNGRGFSKVPGTDSLIHSCAGLSATQTRSSARKQVRWGVVPAIFSRRQPRGEPDPRPERDWPGCQGGYPCQHTGPDRLRCRCPTSGRARPRQDYRHGSG